MNSNNTPTLLEISYYMLGCNKKVKEICVPKYTHLLIIATIFSLIIPPISNEILNDFNKKTFVTVHSIENC